MVYFFTAHLYLFTSVPNMFLPEGVLNINHYVYELLRDHEVQACFATREICFQSAATDIFLEDL